MNATTKRPPCVDSAMISTAESSVRRIRSSDTCTSLSLIQYRESLSKHGNAPLSAMWTSIQVKCKRPPSLSQVECFTRSLQVLLLRIHGLAFTDWSITTRRSILLLMVSSPEPLPLSLETLRLLAKHSGLEI